MVFQEFSIMDIFVLLLLASIVVMLFWFALQKFLTTFRAMSDEEKIALTQRVLENLAPLVLSLVTQAERDYPGPKTGKLKRSQVLSELYRMVPDQFKPYITEDNLSTILEFALDEAREVWHESFTPTLIRYPQD